MPNKIIYTAPAVVTSLNEKIKTPDVLKSLDGLCCHKDHVLNYQDDFPNPTRFRGGFLRLQLGDDESLQVAIELECDERLSTKELKTLKDSLEGQVSDGIGAGCFDFLSEKTDLSVELLPLGSGKKSQIDQRKGNAWLPGKDAAKQNAECCKRAQAVLQAGEKKSSKPGKISKNPNALFRLIDKMSAPITPDFLETLRTEIEKLGGDLSGIPDKQFPFQNMFDVRVLKMLLDAKLRPNLTDCKGNTLLYLSSGHIACMELLLSLGVDINATSGSFKETALMRAAFLGNAKSVEFLLKKGAATAPKTLFGETALQQALNNQEMYLNGQPGKTVTILKNWKP